MATMFAGCVF